MELIEVVKCLRNMAEITVDVEFAETYNEACRLLEELSHENEVLKAGRHCMTVSVTCSPDNIRDIIETAFEQVTGKSFEYVMEAVKEKMSREGEVDVEEETQQTFEI